ncbi:MAG TPA: crosslink repair DNA glycosylase YcaQ family protein [Candidatus Thermoplasmatota archaeon]|nr:crosslink repair DNA glycosylase YcaQ family protein [Candidatus Thermoplasmatota archaeon]
MATPLALADLRRLRARSAGLLGDGFRGVEYAVSGIVAVPAAAPTPALALLPRVRDYRYAEVEDLADHERALVRVTGLRGHTHLVHRALVPALLDATQAPRREATFALAAELGVATPVLDIVRNHVVEALQGHDPMTPGELSRLLERKIPEGERLNRVLALFCAEGTLVRATNKGDWQRNAFTYALLSEWVPEAALPGDETEATRRLADAYVRAYGPVGPHEFSHWSGIPLQEAAAAFAALHGDFFEVEGRTLLGYPVHARLLADGTPEGRAVLLPPNDPLLLAHPPGLGAVSPEAAPWVLDPQGNAASAILVDGQAVGLWEASPSKRRVNVRAALLPNAPPGLLRALEEPLSGLAAFLGVPEVNVERVALPPPLAERPGWAHQLPLRGMQPEEQG